MWQETSLVCQSNDIHSSLLNKFPTHMVQINTEGLSPRVAVNKESIQYRFMTRVISLVKMKVGKDKYKNKKKWHHIVLLAHEVTAVT